MRLFKSLLIVAALVCGLVSSISPASAAPLAQVAVVVQASSPAVVVPEVTPIPLTVHCGVKARWELALSAVFGPYVKQTVHARLTADGKTVKLCSKVRTLKARKSDWLKFSFVQGGKTYAKSTHGRQVEIKSSMTKSTCTKKAKIRYKFIKDGTWYVLNQPGGTLCVDM